MGEIRFVKKKEDWSGVELIFQGQCYVSENPIEIEVKESDGSRSVYHSGYTQTEWTDKGYMAASVVRTKHGSSFLVQDIYKKDGAEITVSRKIEVVDADGHDAGFSSSFGVEDVQRTPLNDYEVFIPGIWYRHNENVVRHAFGSCPEDRHFYMRITRMAMPYVEIYHPGRKCFLVMKHLSPEPDTGIKETGAEWLVDEAFQYASMGLRSLGKTEIRYNFPGSEGEKNYIDGRIAWARRSHPVRKGVKHEYALSVWGDCAEDSYEAMRIVWRYYYDKNRPEHVPADYRQVYEDGIALLNTYCQEYNGAMGLPFWTTVPEGTVCDISFQMGFVGQQTMCAYQMMRYGYQNNDREKLFKARRIIDFWVNESAKTSVVPRVWYNAFPDTFKLDYPTYTRTAADGMEGILACCLLAEQHGEDISVWKAFCIRYGDWLAANQNPDGSWYRAYDEKGNPVHTGKFNTTNVIRYLVNLYWYTDDEKYRKAAEQAGEYCLKAVYEPMQYVGGTADNDNTIDKEAGMIAVYAFAALYELNGDKRYLKAAQGAADFCETWTYVWNYPVRPYKGNAVFDKVNFTGLSLIATGHSHSDVMMGYMPFEYYRLWRNTGDIHYLEFARFLNGNTKQTTDWERKLGHIYPGLVEESGELAMQYHNGLGRWLPWCTIAEIESLTRLEEKFGSMDIEKLLQKENEKPAAECIRSSWLGTNF